MPEPFNLIRRETRDGSRREFHDYESSPDAPAVASFDRTETGRALESLFLSAVAATPGAKVFAVEPEGRGGWLAGPLSDLLDGGADYPQSLLARLPGAGA